MLLVTLCAAGAIQAEAQPGPGAVTGEELTDFRDKLMLGFSLVFLLITGYLVVSHRKNAELGDEIAFLRARIEELHKRYS